MYSNKFQHCFETSHQRIWTELPLRLAIKSYLTPLMKKKRLDVARLYCHWLLAEWKKVLFSDECTMHAAICFDKIYVVATMKRPPSPMVSWNYSKRGWNWNMHVHSCTMFMQDGTPCHQSKAFTDFLKKNMISVLKWPRNSLYINLVKNLWTIIKDKWHTSNCQVLKTRGKQSMKFGTMKSPKLLVSSMPCCIQAVIDSKGGHTKC